MRARGQAKARIVRSLLDEKDWRPRLELLARVYPGEYGRREMVLPAEPERKPMVTKYVFETGGKTLQELTNFPISGDLTPPAAPKTGRSRCSCRSTLPDCWHWWARDRLDRCDGRR